MFATKSAYFACGKPERPSLKRAVVCDWNEESEMDCDEWRSSLHGGLGARKVLKRHMGSHLQLAV